MAEKISDVCRHNWSKIIVAIYFIPLNARTDSHDHFGMHRLSVAVVGAEISTFQNIPSEEKILEYGQK